MESLPLPDLVLERALSRVISTTAEATVDDRVALRQLYVQMVESNNISFSRRRMSLIAREAVRLAHSLDRHIRVASMPRRWNLETNGHLAGSQHVIMQAEVKEEEEEEEDQEEEEEEEEKHNVIMIGRHRALCDLRLPENMSSHFSRVQAIIIADNDRLHVVHVGGVFGARVQTLHDGDGVTSTDAFIGTHTASSTATITGRAIIDLGYGVTVNVS